jgi:hypothetical protein
MKVYCYSCNKPTSHRQKMHDIVCNKCDRCNYPIFLQRVGDGRSNVGKKLIWIEWTEDGRGKAKHSEPQIGFSLCLDPYTIQPDIKGLEDHPPVSGFSWMTTNITEIIEDKILKDYRKIHFMTNNSEYVLHVTTIEK